MKLVDYRLTGAALLAATSARRCGWWHKLPTNESARSSVKFAGHRRRLIDTSSERATAVNYDCAVFTDLFCALPELATRTNSKQSNMTR